MAPIHPCIRVKTSAPVPVTVHASVPSPPRRLALESNRILRLFSNTVNERLAEAGDASAPATGSRSPHLLHARTHKRKTSQNFHHWTATGF